MLINLNRSVQLLLPEEAEQVPEGNNLESPDESKETCDFIRESQTQANDAFSAPDMSVDAIVPRDDPT